MKRKGLGSTQVRLDVNDVSKEKEGLLDGLQGGRSQRSGGEGSKDCGILGKRRLEDTWEGDTIARNSESEGQGKKRGTSKTW